MVWWSQLDKPLSKVTKHVTIKDKLTLYKKKEKGRKLDFDCIDNIDITPNSMRLTSIMATVTPSEESKETVSLVLAGVNIARISLASASRTNHLHIIRNVREAEQICSTKAGQFWPIAIAVELTGHSMCTGLLDADLNQVSIKLKLGDTILITSNREYSTTCSPEILYIDCPNLCSNLKPGVKIIIDGGEIILQCVREAPPYYICHVHKAGFLGSLREVALPGTKLNLCNLTSKDVADIAFAIENEVEMVIVSCRNAETTQTVKNMFIDKRKYGLVLSKICNEEGLVNLDSIVEVSDGIIISQDSLSMELPTETLWRAVHYTIAKCNQRGVPVYFATSKLGRHAGDGGMIMSAASDISRVVLTGASGIVLEGGELGGAGPEPESAAFVAEVCKQNEPACWVEDNLWNMLNSAPQHESVGSAMCYGAAIAAWSTGTTCILIVSTSSRPARFMSRLRTNCPLLTVVISEENARQMHLHRGVVPLIYKESVHAEWGQERACRIRFALNWGMAHGWLRGGSPLVLLTDYNIEGPPGNLLRIVYVPKIKGDYLCETSESSVLTHLFVE